MGPSRSSSLRIGGNSLAVIGFGQNSGTFNRSAGVDLRDAPGVTPSPLDKGKRKID